MPVLDARALERDPDGMAFLLTVLRQQSCGAVRSNPISRGNLTGTAKPERRETGLAPAAKAVCLIP
jgi:hypothetical protein